MTNFSPTDKMDERLQNMARFARVCLNCAECLLSFEHPKYQSLHKSGATNTYIPNLMLISAVTRIIAVVAMLRRYIERPRPLRTKTTAVSIFHGNYKPAYDDDLTLPLGRDACSDLARNLCSHARLMIQQDRVYRFGATSSVERKSGPEGLRTESQVEDDDDNPPRSHGAHCQREHLQTGEHSLIEEGLLGFHGITALALAPVHSPP